MKRSILIIYFILISILLFSCNNNSKNINYSWWTTYYNNVKTYNSEMRLLIPNKYLDGFSNLDMDDSQFTSVTAYSSIIDYIDPGKLNYYPSYQIKLNSFNCNLFYNLIYKEILDENFTYIDTKLSYYTTISDNKPLITNFNDNLLHFTIDQTMNTSLYISPNIELWNKDESITTSQEITNNGYSKCLIDNNVNSKYKIASIVYINNFINPNNNIYNIELMNVIALNFNKSPYQSYYYIVEETNLILKTNTIYDSFNNELTTIFDNLFDKIITSQINITNNYLENSTIQ